MLVLKRKNGQWVEITHSKSGERLRLRVYGVGTDPPGQMHVAFDDKARNFEIHRPEHVQKLT